MYRRLASLIFPLLASLLLLAACASVPVQEMSDARQAIAAARQAQAPALAPILMQRALQRMEAAEQALADQAWGEARSSALAAREDAIAARQQAEQAGSQN